MIQEYVIEKTIQSLKENSNELIKLIEHLQQQLEKLNNAIKEINEIMPKEIYADTLEPTYSLNLEETIKIQKILDGILRGANDKRI